MEDVHCAKISWITFASYFVLFWGFVKLTFDCDDVQWTQYVRYDGEDDASAEECTFGPNSAEGEGDAHLHICPLSSKPTNSTPSNSLNKPHIYFLFDTDRKWNMGPTTKTQNYEILLRSSGPKKNPLILGKRSCNMDSDFHVFSLPLLTCLPWSTPHFHRQQTIMCGRNQRAE